MQWGVSDKGGMGWTGAWARAVAAYTDEVTRIMNGGDGEPTRVALAHRIAQVAWRLGCRTHPMRWCPTHLRERLHEGDVVEAMYICWVDAGVRGVHTGRPWPAPLSEERWRRVEASGGGGAIWEGDGACDFDRGLAGCGIAEVADIYDGAGTIMGWERARAVFEIPAGKKSVYEAVRTRMVSRVRVRAWCANAMQRGRPAMESGAGARMHEWEVERLLAARAGPTNWGGWEYLVQWEGGTQSWEPSVHLERVSTADKDEARVERRVAASHWERLQMAVSNGERTAQWLQEATCGRQTRAVAAGESVKECVATLQCDEVKAAGRECRRVLHVRGEGLVTADVVERVIERLAAEEESYVDVCVTMAADVSAGRMERLCFKTRSEAWARASGVATGPGVTCWVAALRTAADALRRVRDAEPRDAAEWCVERARKGSDAWTLTVSKVNVAARAERAVCEAWGDFCAHALEGGRRGDERKNMREHTAEEGRRGGRWKVERQVVFLGLPSERMADATATPDAGAPRGGREKRCTSAGRGEMQRGQRGPMDDEIACGLSTAGRAMERGDEKRLFAHLTTAEEGDDDGVREDRVAKVMAWYSLLEEGVDAPAGVRVRVGGSEMAQVRKKGIRRTREVGVAVDRIAMWMGTHPVVAAVDGSEKEEGGEKAVAWGRWTGPSDKRGDEDTEEMRRQISGGLGGGRLPDTWDNEHAEVYAIYKTLREYHECGDEEGIVILSDALSMLQSIDKALRTGDARWLARVKCGVLIEGVCDMVSRMGKVALVYNASHEGVRPSAVADAAAKAHLGAAYEEVGWVAGACASRCLMYEARGSDGRWDVVDDPIYKYVKERIRTRRHTCVDAWMRADTDTATCRRMGRERYDVDTKSAERQARRGSDESGELGKHVMRARMGESRRVQAVMAAREGCTRAAEGTQVGWRTGRACSVAEVEARRREDEGWQVVPPRRRGQRPVRGAEGRMIEWWDPEGGEDGGEVTRRGIVSGVRRDGDDVMYEVMKGGGERCMIRVGERAWQWVATGGERRAYAGGARTTAQGPSRRGKCASGRGSVTGTPPAGLMDIWGGARAETRSAGMAAARARMVCGMRKLREAVEEAEGPAGERGRVVRTALAHMQRASMGWTVADEMPVRAVVGAMLPRVRWRELRGRGDARRRYVAWAKERMEAAMVTVQSAAAGVMIAWAARMRVAHWWTSARESRHVWLRAVMGAWRAVAMRARTWGTNTQLWREAGGSEPVWLIPRDSGAMSEWSERGQLTAVHAGSMGARLLWYARATSAVRVASRARYAAWHARAGGVGGIWARYLRAVEEGKRRVAVLSREAFQQRCGEWERMASAREPTWEGMSARCKRGRVEIVVTGGDEHERRVLRRQMARAMEADRGEEVGRSAHSGWTRSGRGRGGSPAGTRGRGARGGRGRGAGTVGRGGTVARVTSGLCARMEWVMERRWWVVGETAGDVGEEGDDANAPEGEPEEAMPGEEDEEDERVAWAAAEAAEGAADADDAWEDEYQREMTMEAEMMMEADAFGDG